MDIINLGPNHWTRDCYKQGGCCETSCEKKNGKYVNCNSDKLKTCSDAIPSGGFTSPKPQGAICPCEGVKIVYPISNEQADQISSGELFDRLVTLNGAFNLIDVLSAFNDISKAEPEPNKPTPPPPSSSLRKPIFRICEHHCVDMNTGENSSCKDETETQEFVNKIVSSFTDKGIPPIVPELSTECKQGDCPVGLTEDECTLLLFLCTNYFPGVDSIGECFGRLCQLEPQICSYPFEWYKNYLLKLLYDINTTDATILVGTLLLWLDDIYGFPGCKELSGAAQYWCVIDWLEANLNDPTVQLKLKLFVLEVLRSLIRPPKSWALSNDIIAQIEALIRGIETGQITPEQFYNLIREIVRQTYPRP